MSPQTPSQHVHQEIEVDRLSGELAAKFHQFDPATIETVVRAEFSRRSARPVQDFVPIFVERTLRKRLQRVTA